jgi:formylglycine-generating enzyme required for sulfatase activity
MKKLFRLLIVFAALAALVFLGAHFLGGGRGTASALPDPAEFATIPAGAFTMGDTLDLDRDAPPHGVAVSAFFMQRREVSKAQWDEVHAWGLKHGYPDLPEGKGKAADHPVTEISWYDAVKWCNARSEQDGLVPCYYTDAGKKRVYRREAVPGAFDKLLKQLRGFLRLAAIPEYWDLDETMVRWDANGYRLPTEAEWEKAARGGLEGKRFPWGNTISHQETNFVNSGRNSYQRGASGYHPDYAKGDRPFTAPVGSFPANGYGLHDMAGNVCEWCWDWKRAYPTASETDPHGLPSSPTWPVLCRRITRGGGWSGSSHACRVSNRDYLPPSDASTVIGFRPVRRSTPISRPPF